MTLLHDFAAFAAAKPADETYRLYDTENCAVAQFAKSITPDFAGAAFTAWTNVDGSWTYLTKGDSEYQRLWNAVCNGTALDADYRVTNTWGQLAIDLKACVEAL